MTVDPTTMRYLRAAERALYEARHQVCLALDHGRDNKDRELRVLFAIHDRGEAVTNLRRALNRLEFSNGMRQK